MQTMVEADRIEALSISFVSGVALAAVSGAFLRPGVMLWIVCCWLAFMLSAQSELHGTLPYLLLYLLLGAFCFCLRRSAAPPSNPFETSLQALASRIDGTGFSDPRTTPLVKALLTGVRTDIPAEIKADFRLSGASHILALSGLHLGVVYAGLSGLLSPLGRTQSVTVVRSAVTVTFCSIYTVMTGAAPSTVRALLFIVLREVGRIDVRRKAPPLRIYCVALLLQLAVWPEVILSLGFQLSYLAVCGIVLLFPVLQGWMPESGVKVLDKYLPSRWLWNAMALSVSCQIFTAPLVWWRFSTFPKYFLLTNVLSLPLAEALILASIACVALSWLGFCSDFLVSLTDFLAVALIRVMEVIAVM